jgi:hypothetical protein
MNYFFYNMLAAIQSGDSARVQRLLDSKPRRELLQTDHLYAAVARFARDTSHNGASILDAVVNAVQSQGDAHALFDCVLSQDVTVRHFDGSGMGARLVLALEKIADLHGSPAIGKATYVARSLAGQQPVF